MKRIFWAGILLLQLIIVKAANVFKIALLVSPDKTPKKQSSYSVYEWKYNSFLSWFNFWKQIILENSALSVFLEILGISEKFLRIHVRIFGDHLMHAKKYDHDSMSLPKFLVLEDSMNNR